LGPELAPKRDQKWDHFWNPLPPPLRGPNDAIFCELKGSAAKATVTGIIFGKRKGGIKGFYLVRGRVHHKPVWWIRQKAQGRARKKARGTMDG